MDTQPPEPSHVIKIYHSNTIIMYAGLFVLNKVPLFLIFRRYIIRQKNVCFRLQAQKKLGRVGRNINVY